MIFVDTNVFVGALNVLDEKHGRALPLLREAWAKCRPIFLTDYVLAESLAVAWRQTKNQDLVFKIDEYLQSKELRMSIIDERLLSTAKTYMRKYPDVIHTLTDWTSLIVCRDERLNGILSFDRGFDHATEIADFQNIQRIESVEQLSTFLDRAT